MSSRPNNGFFHCFHSEVLKLWYLKTTKIVVALVVFLQTVMAFYAAQQLLAVGLDATPETHHKLIEAVPTVEHIGFETLLFGLLPMAVWGAVFGALEFKTHSMRTSLLSIHSKPLLFAVKFVVMLLVAWFISMGSIVASISATHLSLGSAGLAPITLSPLVWKWMLLASVSWTSVTVLAFVIGFLFRTAVAPLLFLIPQIYNGGNLLAEHFWPAKYLPVAMGNTLIATSERIDQIHLRQSISVLVLWILILGIAAYWRFHKCDLGGRY